MSNTVIKVENLSKQYRLGQVSTGTLSHDINRWWHTIRGKEDPYLKISEVNDRTQKGTSEYVWALRDINFDVKHGEVLGIIGRNGAGKSTLLKILSRTTAPTTGSIKIKGKVASLLEVGTGFHPDLSGRENIFLNGAILGMNKKEITRKFDEIVDFAGVERYIDTPVKRYSSGMYVRLAFAVAAHLEPEILIVDEVLAVGDSEFQKKCLGKMKDVSEREGRTVLFVSHNMAAVKNLCTKGLFMSNGKSTPVEAIDDVISLYIDSINSTINVPVFQRSDRSGTGEVKIQKAWFEKSSGEISDTFKSGDDVKIVIEYRAHRWDHQSKLAVAIAISNSHDYQLTDLFSETVGNIWKNVSDNGRIECLIENIPFNIDKYYVNILLRKDDEVADWVQKATVLNIIEGDFYGTGRLHQANQGSILLNQKWSIK